MRRILALALHPAAYGTLTYVQLWRTRRLFPDMSPEGEGLGAGMLIAAALLAQVGFAFGLIAFAKRVRAARAAQVALFTFVTAAVGVPFCILAFDLGAQLETLFPRVGHILFLFSPLWATSLVTIVCALILLPKTARIVTLDSAATVIRTA